jgi:Fe-S-cluster containining protein
MSRNSGVKRAIRKTTEAAIQCDEYARHALPILEEMQAAKISCKTGCNHCCYQLVSVHMPEALAILDHYASPGNALPSQRNSLVEWINEKSKWIATGTVTEDIWFRKKTKCAFLSSEGLCRIYGIRPLPCRAHFSLSDSQFCSPDTPEAKIVRPDFRAMQQRMILRLIGVCHEAGLPEGLIPFPVALQWGMVVRERGVTGLRMLLSKTNIPAYSPVDHGFYWAFRLGMAPQVPTQDAEVTP